MMGRAIRARMAQASILPVLLVVITIVSIFWQGRVQDLEASHQQRVGLLVHQAAVFSAYGLFSGNTASLQSLVQEMQREPGVISVQVFDAEGRAVASSGTSALRRFADLEALQYVERQRALQIDVLAQPILPSVVPVEDMFSPQETPTFKATVALGSAVVEVSRKALDGKKRSALLTALWVGLSGILLGGLLAYRLGDRVVNPMLRVSQMVQRIGQGNFATSQDILPDDPLRELQVSLNLMAKRLAWGRDDLERQVESVTLELRRKKEQAESATLAKSRFLAAASHDLRQPSHALGMFVARLGQLPMQPQMRQLVDNLELSVQAMQDLLDGLLDLSRLDSGNVQVRMGPVDLNDLLGSVRSALESSAETKGLRLRVRPTTLWATSDALLLQRMLFNLVINAIRYTEQGGVLVACRPCDDGSSVCIEVRDSGIGIPAEHHEDIFKEFYQLSNRAGDRNFGLGLGLNIVQRSAALLGHGITLRSQVGCGTRFSIVLARCEPGTPLVQHTGESLQPALGDISGLQVLVIEDNTQAREAVRELLLSWGCQVQEAANQVQALQQLHQHGVPDVILSDYHLGASETGIACITALRGQAGVQIAACLMSGETHEDFLQEVKAADLPLLHKPVRPAKLRSLLRHMQP
ncbi:hybrid sensor histidine kinase/response regulator [Rhodoferax lacus]|uniref:histidine kinase n=1 Tax=Rhodoferax lacus TaxID=2184758 RepID=A0A3E1R744_9BURK|nr:ATP-binding protein [Rhodoferax lacus]RFO95186.1 hybrid sensor histidine kinase/response regulator [Rhodoferax lacus]